MYSFASRTYDGQEADYADGQSHKQNTCAVVAVVSTGLSFLTLDECTECTNNFNSLSGEPGQTLLVFRVAFTIFFKINSEAFLGTCSAHFVKIFENQLLLFKLI